MEKVVRKVEVTMNRRLITESKDSEKEVLTDFLKSA